MIYGVRDFICIYFAGILYRRRDDDDGSLLFGTVPRESRTLGIPKLPPAGLATTGVPFSFNFELGVVFVLDFIVRQDLFVIRRRGQRVFSVVI